MKNLGIPNTAELAALKIILGTVAAEVALARSSSIAGANDRLRQMAESCDRSALEMNLNITPGSGIDRHEFIEATRAEIANLFGGLAIS